MPGWTRGAAIQVAIGDDGVERRPARGCSRTVRRAALRAPRTAAPGRRRRPGSPSSSRTGTRPCCCSCTESRPLVVELHRPLVLGFDADEFGGGAVAVRLGDAELSAAPPGAGSSRRRPAITASTVPAATRWPIRAGTSTSSPRDLGRDVGDLADELARVGGAHGEVSSAGGDGAHRHRLGHRRVAGRAGGAALRPAAEGEHGRGHEHERRDGKTGYLRAADPAASGCGVRVGACFLVVAMVVVVRLGHELFVLSGWSVLPFRPSRSLRRFGSCPCRPPPRRARTGGSRRARSRSGRAAPGARRRLRFRPPA